MLISHQHIAWVLHEQVMGACYLHPERTEENSLQEEDFLLSLLSFLGPYSGHFFSISLLTHTFFLIP